MELTQVLQDQALIITLQGEKLEAKETAAFKEKVLQLIEQYNATQVVLDLKALQFIDSAGLNALLSILRQLNSKGGDLKLSSLSKPVRSLLELASMDKVFEIYDSLPR